MFCARYKLNCTFSVHGVGNLMRKYIVAFFVTIFSIRFRAIAYFAGMCLKPSAALHCATTRL